MCCVHPPKGAIDPAALLNDGEPGPLMAISACEDGKKREFVPSRNAQCRGSRNYWGQPQDEGERKDVTG